MMQPGFERMPVGSRNWKPSLATLRSISAYMCRAIVSRLALSKAICGRARSEARRDEGAAGAGGGTLRAAIPRRSTV